MSDIGLLPPGANAFFPAVALALLGMLVAVGAAVRAGLQARRLRCRFLEAPASDVAGAGAMGVVLAVALATTASEASLETREELDVWWAAWSVTVVIGALALGWALRRRRVGRAPVAP